MLIDLFLLSSQMMDMDIINTTMTNHLFFFLWGISWIDIMAST